MVSALMHHSCFGFPALSLDPLLSFFCLLPTEICYCFLLLTPMITATFFYGTSFPKLPRFSFSSVTVILSAQDFFPAVWLQARSLLYKVNLFCHVSAMVHNCRPPRGNQSCFSICSTRLTNTFASLLSTPVTHQHGCWCCLLLPFTQKFGRGLLQCFSLPFPASSCAQITSFVYLHLLSPRAAPQFMLTFVCASTPSQVYLSLPVKL